MDVGMRGTGEIPALLPPPSAADEGLILSAPVRIEVGPMVDLEKFIAECQATSQIAERLLTGARGYETWRRLSGLAPKTKTAQEERATLLAELHGTVLTRAELFVVWQINSMSSGGARLGHDYDIQALGEELAGLWASEESTWAGLPFAEWRDEVTLRNLAFGAVGPAGTRFI